MTSQYWALNRLEDNLMSSIATVGPRTLADVIPGGLVRNIVLVVGGAVLVGLTAQVAFPLPFTPVPVTLQTLTVLLAGAALGPIRGGLSMLLYLLVGVAGVPWFSEQESGWQLATFGYIIGFVVAATLVGALARRGADRTVLGAAFLMILGNLVIYVIGVAWLANWLAVDLPTALEFGAWPFLIGDALKIALAAGLLPAAWKLAGERPAS